MKHSESYILSTKIGIKSYILSIFSLFFSCFIFLYLTYMFTTVILALSWAKALARKVHTEHSGRHKLVIVSHNKQENEMLK